MASFIDGLQSVPVRVVLAFQPSPDSVVLMLPDEMRFDYRNMVDKDTTSECEEYFQFSLHAPVDTPRPPDAVLTDFRRINATMYGMSMAKSSLFKGLAYSVTCLPGTVIGHGQRALISGAFEAFCTNEHLNMFCEEQIFEVRWLN